MKTIEKIAMLKTLVQMYRKGTNIHLSMCGNLNKLLRFYEIENNLKFNDIFFYIPEFCRHEKHGQPVNWFEPLDVISRIKYINETIEIIENDFKSKISKVENLLLLAAKDNNFEKVAQAKYLLNELKTEYYELSEHRNY